MGEGLLQMSCFPNALRPISYAFIDSVDIHHIFIISIATDGSMRFLLFIMLFIFKIYSTVSFAFISFSKYLLLCQMCFSLIHSFIHSFSKYLGGPLCTPS